jgi:2-phospho-L-lactate transferase/gluconeogenesis factor (CofD/UPF0052 family)
MGGGTGTHAVLTGLKPFEGLHLSAIVSIADNGGSSGRLRDEFGILPPGDTRQCMVALAEAPEELRELLNDRDKDGHPAAIEAIRASDAIVLGPGDLYTSLVPVLLIPGIARAIAESDAWLIFVVNLVTKRGQTDGYGATRFVRTIESHLDGRLFDHIILNDGPIDSDLLVKYEQEVEGPVRDDLLDDARVLRGDFVGRKPIIRVVGDPLPRSLIRHD